MSITCFVVYGQPRFCFLASVKLSTIETLDQCFKTFLSSESTYKENGSSQKRLEADLRLQGPQSESWWEQVLVSSNHFLSFNHLSLFIPHSQIWREKDPMNEWNVYSLKFTTFMNENSRSQQLCQWMVKNRPFYCFLIVTSYTPLYEKGIKKSQNKSMETTFVYLSKYFLAN